MRPRVQQLVGDSASSAAGRFIVDAKVWYRWHRAAPLFLLMELPLIESITDRLSLLYVSTGWPRFFQILPTVKVGPYVTFNLCTTFSLCATGSKTYILCHQTHHHVVPIPPNEDLFDCLFMSTRQLIHLTTVNQACPKCYSASQSF